MILKYLEDKKNFISYSYQSIYSDMNFRMRYERLLIKVKHDIKKTAATSFYSINEDSLGNRTLEFVNKRNSKYFLNYNLQKLHELHLKYLYFLIDNIPLKYIDEYIYKTFLEFLDCIYYEVKNFNSKVILLKVLNIENKKKHELDIYIRKLIYLYEIEDIFTMLNILKSIKKENYNSQVNLEGYFFPLSYENDILFNEHTSLTEVNIAVLFKSKDKLKEDFRSTRDYIFENFDSEIKEMYVKEECKSYLSSFSSRYDQQFSYLNPFILENKHFNIFFKLFCNKTEFKKDDRKIVLFINLLNEIQFKIIKQQQINLAYKFSHLKARDGKRYKTRSFFVKLNRYIENVRKYEDSFSLEILKEISEILKAKGLIGKSNIKFEELGILEADSCFSKKKAIFENFYKKTLDSKDGKTLKNIFKESYNNLRDYLKKTSIKLTNIDRVFLRQIVTYMILQEKEYSEYIKKVKYELSEEDTDYQTFLEEYMDGINSKYWEYRFDNKTFFNKFYQKMFDLNINRKNYILNKNVIDGKF